MGKIYRICYLVCRYEWYKGDKTWNCSRVRGTRSQKNHKSEMCSAVHSNLPRLAFIGLFSPRFRSWWRRRRRRRNVKKFSLEPIDWNVKWANRTHPLSQLQLYLPKWLLMVFIFSNIFQISRKVVVVVCEEWFPVRKSFLYLIKYLGRAMRSSLYKRTTHRDTFSRVVELLTGNK